MSQLSETTESYIGSVYLTATAATGGLKARVIWRTFAWSPILRTVVPGLYSTETQEYDRGAASHTLNWPVELLIEWCPDVLYGALRTQCDTLATTYAASLVPAATNASGAEVAKAFTALRWKSLVPDQTVRFGSRTYTGVLATLTSEA